MSWYREAKLGFIVISRFLTYKITKTAIQNKVSLIKHNTQLSKFPSYTNYLVSRLPRTNILGFRFYGSGYRYSIPRVSEGLSNVHKLFLRIALVASGLIGGMIYSGLETIPYTKRKHITICSKRFEKKIGESYFKELKSSMYKGKILPENYRDSVRVTMILGNIIEAFKRGLKRHEVFDGTPKKGDMSVNDHLLGLNWEVLVVNNDDVNSFCAPGGKIVVFTGLLKHCKTDEEIATVIGREVAHVVARHTAECCRKNLRILYNQRPLFQFIGPNAACSMSTNQLELPFSWWMENEADYIGLMLMASAGYDPRAAPKVYEKLGQVSGIRVPSLLYYQPSGNTRSKALSEEKVMQEALSKYQEAKVRSNAKLMPEALSNYREAKAG